MTIGRTSWPRLLRQLIPARPAPEGSDASLLEQFVRHRDEAAFAALMQRHGPMVLGVCRRVLHEAQDADDVFQATFLVLVRKAAVIRHPELLGNWLYGVAYHIALQARAGAARWRSHERQVEDVPAPEPVDERIWEELRPLLDEEIHRLPEKYRAPVVLCYLEGKTYAEAARMLGWAEGTVSGRLARAREKLRTRLAFRGLTLSAATLAATLGQQGSAAVPAALAQVTFQAAALTAAAGPAAAAGLISAQAAALSQAALQTTFAVKLKILGAVVAAAGLVGLGGAVVSHGSANPAWTSRPVTEDRDQLQGTWRWVAGQEAGHASAPKDLSWSFQGNQLIVQSGDQRLQGTYQLNRAYLHMRTIDITLPSAAGGPPTTLYGIYGFENEGLSVCFTTEAARRPLQFDSTPSNGQVFYEFRRP
jgi:RNA polymerase sigma factor (sigma-70 family)